MRLSLIGVGQCRVRDTTSKTHVIELAAHGTQACFDIAEALAVSELGEAHRQILIPARQASAMTVAAIAKHASLELHVGKVRDQLRENRAAIVHPPLFRRDSAGGQNRFSKIRFQFSLKSFLTEFAVPC